jgi:hypothetical protein
MKHIYFLLSGLLILSSCSPHLITRGITDKTSNYVVTNTGKKIYTSTLSVNGQSVSTDSAAAYSLSDLSAIKTGEAYYGVKNGKYYDGVYFGKLILLRRFAGYTYTVSATNRTTTPNYSYYLQKEGQPEILDFTGKNLVESVRDNPLALRKARSARIFGTINIATAATTIAGLSCVFLSYNSPIRKPAVTIGLYSLPVFLVTLPIAGHKKYKAIVVYDR